MTNRNDQNIDKWIKAKAIVKKKLTFKNKSHIISRNLTFIFWCQYEPTKI